MPRKLYRRSTLVDIQYGEVRGHLVPTETRVEPGLRFHHKRGRTADGASDYVGGSIGIKTKR
jgi:hypothetical protein